MAQFRRPLCRDDGAGQAAKTPGQFLEKLGSGGPIAKLVIQKQRIGGDLEILHQLQRAFGVFAFDHADAPAFDKDRHGAPQLRIVFDQ